MVITDNQHNSDAECSKEDTIKKNYVSSKSKLVKSGSDDPTDGRIKYDWATRYPKEAIKEIRIESIILFSLLFIALTIIFLTWYNQISLSLNLSEAQSKVFKCYSYYSMSGLLGGVLFAFKNLYKSVARGWWHQDRKIWRIISPFVAMVVGFVVGAMVEASLISSKTTANNHSIISIGFISGYFADRAIGKMREIAAVIFGKSIALDDNVNK